MQSTIHFSSVEFRNYKAFAQYSLTLGDLNVLVGANNSGKSTILGAFRALDIAIRRARLRKPEYLSGPNGKTFGYHLPEDSFPLSLENIHTEYLDIDTTITFRLSNGNKLQLFFPQVGGWILIAEAAERPVRDVAAFKAAYPVSMAIVPILGPVEHREHLIQQETVQRSLFTHLASRHFRNYWHYFPDGFDAFSTLLRETWPGMDISPPEFIDRGSGQLSMFCSENRITRELFWAGFGFQVWCQLLTHICRSKESTILIVDEPEVYLHPDVQRQLLSLVRTMGVDVLLATHSTEIISEADPSEIILIAKNDRSAKRLRDIDGVQNVLSSIGSVHNLTLTRLAKNRTLLFTEGIKDLQVLRQFARRLNLSNVASGSHFTSETSEGMSSIDRIKSLKWGLQKALGHVLTIGAIYDRDYLCSEEVRCITDGLADQLELFHIHDRKEIENYLLVPVVLQRAFEREIREIEKRTLGSRPIVTETIANILGELSLASKAELQGQYIAKRSEFLRGTKQDAATINLETLQTFESSWMHLETRMKIVAGKELLGMLRQYLHSKYSVSLTDHKIIAAFRVEEIPADLITLLKRLDSFGAKHYS